MQGLSIFLPTILADQGWTATKAQLYSVPPYVAACLIAIAIAYTSDKTRRRGIYLAVATIFPIAGFSILRWSRNVDARYAAVFLITTGAFPGGPGFMSWGINSKSFLFKIRQGCWLMRNRLCWPCCQSCCHRIYRVGGYTRWSSRNVSLSLIYLDPFEPEREINHLQMDISCS